MGRRRPLLSLVAIVSLLGPSKRCVVATSQLHGDDDFVTQKVAVSPDNLALSTSAHGDDDEDGALLQGQGHNGPL